MKKRRNVMTVFAMVVAGIAIACVSVATPIFTAKKISPSKRAAKLESRMAGEKYSGKTISRKLIKNYNRQKTALHFHRKPLMERVNYFKFSVNGDDDFNQIWDKRTTDKTWRMIGIAKSKKKIAQLKLEKASNSLQRSKAQRKLNKANKQIAKLAEFGKGAMKDYGWMEAGYLAKSAGNVFVNTLHQYDKDDKSKVDNEVEYQMIATRNKEEYGYDAGDIFGKLQKKARSGKLKGALGSSKYKNAGASFKRFGIDYPTTSEFSSVPDRFVVGEKFWKSNIKATLMHANIMFGSLKLVMLANACAKLSDDKDMKKIRIIDESKIRNKVQVVNREDVAEYIQNFINSQKGQLALKTLLTIDKGQAQAIQETIQGFDSSIKFGKAKKSKSEKKKEEVVVVAPAAAEADKGDSTPSLSAEQWEFLMRLINNNNTNNAAPNSTNPNTQGQGK